MSIFINRKQELEFLEKKYASRESELIILYGRRRIGKTELLLKFCENKNYLYFMGRLESNEDTIKRFNNELIIKFNDNALLDHPLKNWNSIFDYIFEKSEKRIIIAIDEFPFIVDRFPEILSIIQDKWDSKLKNSKLMLVLLGSSIGMMEKYALDYKSPIYGRRTGQWKVEKIGIEHFGDFFPNYSIEEKIQIFSCTGGIPGYLSKFNPNLDFWKNIEEKLFSKGEFLYEEVEILLREEFRNPSNYMSIISSIAGGLTSFNEIYNKTGLDKSLLSKYLYILERLGIVERTLPITESYKSKLKAKRALYIIKDNFFDFWFRFVYLNKQDIERGNPKKILNDNKKYIKEFITRKFESFIMELFFIGKFGSFEKIGRWWDKLNEIDIVAMNTQNDEILFCECKYNEDIDSEKVLTLLKEKSKNVKWKNDKRKESFIIFAKSFNKKIEKNKYKNVLFLDLKDIGKLI